MHVVDTAWERTAVAILRLRERRAVLELAKLDRDLAQLQNSAIAPAPVPGGMTLLVLLNEHLAAERRRSDQAHQALMVAQQACRTNASRRRRGSGGGLGEMLKTFTAIAGVVDDLRGGQEPADPLTGLIGMVLPQLAKLASAGLAVEQEAHYRIGGNRLCSGAEVSAFHRDRLPVEPFAKLPEPVPVLDANPNHGVGRASSH